MNNKIILAFSGGLDTTFSIPYLQEKGFEVITVTVNSGGFSDEEIIEIEQKAKNLGVVKHYTVDAQSDLFEQIIKWVIMTNGLYEDSYPNLCADRYLIAAKSIEIARKENAEYIAHGSTAMGNDQVRFNMALTCLAPDIKIVEPVKDPDINGSRDKEIAYLEDKGITYPSKHKKYSINQNVMGITYSGSEIDRDEEPEEGMFKLTKINNQKDSEYFEVGFESGIPVSLNGTKMEGIEIVKKLNKEVGECGYGKAYYTGDTIIGIKGHIAIEAPGIFSLIVAHKALEQYVLTKEQIIFGKEVSAKMTDLIFTGKLFDPLFENLKEFVLSQQENVTGVVKLKLENGSLLPVSVNSKYSLVNHSIGSYAQSSSWTSEDANGFIKLYGLQQYISNQIKK
jgi:argininosuccinate synthase